MGHLLHGLMDRDALEEGQWIAQRNSSAVSFSHAETVHDLRSVSPIS